MNVCFFLIESRLFSQKYSSFLSFLKSEEKKEKELIYNTGITWKSNSKLNKI